MSEWTTGGKVGNWNSSNLGSTVASDFSALQDLLWPNANHTENHLTLNRGIASKLAVGGEGILAKALFRFPSDSG
jgi:hypothetical protein